MSMEPDGTGRQETDGTGRQETDGGPAPKDEPVLPAPSPVPSAPSPLLPTQSSEDTDVGWGDYAEQDDDWLLRDRPPHWDR